MSKRSPYFNTCENCGANLDPGETCDCNKKDTISTNLQPGDILYICDRQACQICYPYCFHTRDIRHAKNFEINEFAQDSFIERYNYHD